MAIPEWIGITNKTIRNYMKGFEPNLIRRMKLFALLNDLGLIEYNCDGVGYDWPVEFQRSTVSGNRANTSIAFPNVNRFQRGFLEPRGLIATESMSELEKQMNKGKPALIKYVDKIVSLLTKDIERQFGIDPYVVDGNATGYTQRIHGFPSFLKQNGQTLTINTVTPEAYSAADIVMVPSATYADLTTGLGDYGGSWTGAWPIGGNGDDVFDFNSPLIINANSTAFAGTSANFAQQGKDAMRFMIMGLQKDASGRGGLTHFFLDREWMREFKSFNDSMQRIAVTSDLQLRSLGFKDVIEFDGVEVTGDFGVPTNVAYAINMNQLVFRSWLPSLVGTEGPVKDLQTQSYRFLVRILGNLYPESSVKYFGKIGVYSGTSD